MQKLIQSSRDVFVDEVRVLQEFVAHMGITAEVRRDFISKRPLVIIATEQFHKHRAWIEAWFVMVDENAGYSYFYERPRGTGDTR